MVDRSSKETGLCFQKPKYLFVARPYARRRQLLSTSSWGCGWLFHSSWIANYVSLLTSQTYAVVSWRRTNAGSVILSLSTQNRIEFFVCSLSDGQESLSFRPLLAITIPSMRFWWCVLLYLAAWLCFVISNQNSMRWNASAGPDLDVLI